MAAPNLGMAALVASLQEHAAYFDVPTFLASLNGQRLSHQALQKAFQEALQEQTLQTIKARFAATKVCSGNKCTARHAIDALNGSDEPLPLPPANPGNIGWFLMDHPFAPCTTGLDDLLPVMLESLVMGSHHRGKFLLVELVKVITIDNLETIMAVRDGAGGVERLKVNTVCIKMNKDQQWLQSGRWFIIKEPFFTQDEKKETNSPCIRIDHPSDLVDANRLPDSLLERKSLHRVLAVVGKRSAQLCRESGNFAFVRGDLSTSHDCYTEGLNIIVDHPEQQDEVTKRDLHHKRAHVRLKLGRYEGAIADALASLSEDPDTINDRFNAQAYFSDASAHYNLKHFDRAHKLLQKQLKVTPEAGNGQELLGKTIIRLQEQRDGIYDVAAIKSALATQPRVDAADYFVNTIVKPSVPGRGRGLYAIKDLAPEDLILAETAFSSALAGENITGNGWSARRPDELRGLFVGLWSSLVQKVANNPIEAQKFLDLHATSDGVGSTVNEIDGTSVVDIFQVHDIMNRHAFPLDDSGPAEPNKRGSMAAFVRTAYINHACIPNSVRISLGDFSMLHAIKPITEGEEITLCYNEGRTIEKPFKERVRNMQTGWGYQCCCRLCVADAQCSPATHAKRDGLVKAALAIIHAPLATRSTPNATLRMEQLARDIAVTYDDEVYSGLPRLATIPVHAFLVVSHNRSTADSIPKATQSIIGLLRACGYRVDQQNNKIRHVAPTVNSFAWDEIDVVRQPLMYHAIMAHVSGDAQTAGNLYAFVSSLERICSGDNTQTAKIRREHFI